MSNTKKAVILHGTDGNPSDHWLPWLENQLENRGYEVCIPELPKNHTPNRFVYEKFLRESSWDFSDNILIGHSSGATTALNLLSAEWFPKVKSTVLVGTFLNEKLLQSADWYEPGQFDNLFLDHYDSEKLKLKSESFYFVHGDNDPYCDIEDAKKLCDAIKGKFITIKDGHHLSNYSGLKSLPGVIEKLEEVL